YVRLRESRGRPARMTRRGPASIYLDDQVRLMVDNVRVYDLQVLDQMPASDILTIEVLDGLEATTRYGGTSTAGLVIIHTKTGSQYQSTGAPPSWRPRASGQNASDHGLWLVHCTNLGLFCSSRGMGRLTALPYNPPLTYSPVGYTLSTGRPYWRASRRRSPRRCPVL